VALLAPVALVPTPAGLAALLALPGLWLCRWLATGRCSPAARRFIRRTPLDGAVLLLLVIVLASLFAGHSIEAGLPKIAGMILGVGAYYAAVEALGGGRRLGWGAGLYLALGAGLAALALAGTNWPVKSSGLARVAADLPIQIRGWPGAEAGFHPNEVAGALLWFLPLAISECAASLRLAFAPAPAGSWQSQRARVFRLVAACLALALMAGVLALTQSRGAALGLAAGLVVMLAGLGRWGRRLAILVLLPGFWALWQAGQVPLRQLLPGGPAAASAGTFNLAGRAELWSRALYAIRDFPFTGLGLNAFRDVAPVLYPMFRQIPSRDFGHAHNQFLQIALDLGIPGLIAYLALGLAAGLLLARAWRQARDAWVRSMALGLGSSLVAFFVYGLTDAIALGARPALAFWLLLALAVGAWQASLPQPD
jgi:putative inorganic carbon (HCO3(-)) transporter